VFALLVKVEKKEQPVASSPSDDIVTPVPKPRQLRKYSTLEIFFQQKSSYAVFMHNHYLYVSFVKYSPSLTLYSLSLTHWVTLLYFYIRVFNIPFVHIVITLLAIRYSQGR